MSNIINGLFSEVEYSETVPGVTEIRMNTIPLFPGPYGRSALGLLELLKRAQELQILSPSREGPTRHDSAVKRRKWKKQSSL